MSFLGETISQLDSDDDTSMQLLLDALLELERKFEAKVDAIILKVRHALAKISNNTIAKENVQNKNE